MIGRFTKVKSLGSGAFGEVSLISDLNGDLYAVKSIDETSYGSVKKGIETLLNQKLIGAHLVRYYEQFCEGSKRHIIMEYCEKGSLDKWMNEQTSISQDQVLKIFAHAVDGLSVLHDNNIVHGDVKPQNILVNRLGEIKISDFGTFVVQCLEFESTTSLSGTIGYIPAEVIQGGPISTSADIFALGCTLYYVMTRRLPFDAPDELMMIPLILRGDFPIIEESAYSDELKRLVYSMLNMKPSNRPTLVQLKKHRLLEPLFRQFSTEWTAPPGPKLFMSNREWRVGGGNQNYFANPNLYGRGGGGGGSPNQLEKANVWRGGNFDLGPIGRGEGEGSPYMYHPLQMQTDAQSLNLPTEAIVKPKPTLTPIPSPVQKPVPQPTLPSTPADEVTEYIQATAANNPETSFTAADFRREFEDILGRKATLAEVTLFMKAQKNARTETANGGNSGGGGKPKVEVPKDAVEQSILSKVVNGYKLTELLGKGSFGEVFKCTKDGRDFAMKRIDESKMSAQMEQAFATNISVNLNSPFLVRYFETFRMKSTGNPKGEVYIVMELCPQGDLSSLLKSFRGVKDAIIDPVRIIKILTQLALGLEVLHRGKILHRDLKPENVFVDANDNVKIGDFGCAVELEYTCEKRNTIIGTPLYESPEVCDGKDYDSSSDMWAVGVMLYELCTLKRPFNNSNPHKLSKLIIAGRYDPIPRFRCPNEVREIVTRLLTVNSQQRLTALQILQDPFIQEAAKDSGLLKEFPARANLKK